MANLGEAIDIDNIVPERGDFEPLPAGNYMAQVIDSDVVDTKANDGKILKLTLEVMDGPHANRKIWVNLNYINKNATAQRIAAETIKKICDAVGHTGQLTDSEVLHYRPMRVKVTIRKSEEYGDQNDVKGWYSLSSSAPPEGKAPPQSSGGGGSAPSSPSAGARAGGSGRPWGNGKAA